MWKCIAFEYVAMELCCDGGLVHVFLCCISKTYKSAHLDVHHWEALPYTYEPKLSASGIMPGAVKDLVQQACGPA